MPQISAQEFEQLPLRIHDFLAGVPLKPGSSAHRHYAGGRLPVPQIRRSVLDNLTCIYVINKMYISLNGRWNLWR